MAFLPWKKSVACPLCRCTAILFVLLACLFSVLLFQIISLVFLSHLIVIFLKPKDLPLWLLEFFDSWNFGLVNIRNQEYQFTPVMQQLLAALQRDRLAYPIKGTSGCWAVTVQQDLLLQHHLPAGGPGVCGSSNASPSPTFQVLVHRGSNKIQFSFWKWLIFWRLYLHSL